MRATLPLAQTGVIAAQIERSPGIDRVRTLNDGFAAATGDTITAIVDEAARYASDWLGPLNDAADAQGCKIVHGRLKTPAGHRAAWDAFVANGWSTLDHPEEEGGQALPLALATAVQEVFDRSCPAFGMLAVPQRSAARLIRAHGDAAMRAEWLPRLVAGEWGATICISEPEAGSDIGRLRTRAEPNVDGSWSITGEKVWISFGDHDLTSRIGHCLLARTPSGAGLSLFLVPDMLSDGTRNAIALRRIEEKMGLHGSPTCALGFEGAAGWMIGTEGRGLAQMFVMITNMRLSVGVQGLGIASAAADVAWGYAAERKQGGPPAAPVTLDRHADVQRMLMDSAARVDCLRGLIQAAANMADIAAFSADAEERENASALAQWLLPIVKTTGGEYAFENASDAMQVLGGAGYTREWPAEQALRDARVLTIFEGTTGIQGLDLAHRRLVRGDRRGYSAFLAEARRTAVSCPVPEAARFVRALGLFEQASQQLIGKVDVPRDIDAGATAYLHLAALVATGWIAAHQASFKATDPDTRRLVATGRYWLSAIDDRAALLAAQATAGAEALSRYDAIASVR
ncbi:acyl-CoA dehydrogenase family protein [Novosphingobium sp.]|uniref:acyl-CoA dehydrogenase family protein n=1 Tax=Novosphingobium sp. TaxID=1874826 RepID=UPI0026160772|nr:acyl-CoA dehydrogenase family protein [Novosphingobium sp.]